MPELYFVNENKKINVDLGVNLREASIDGGVGIYSNRYPYTEVVRHGENGLLAGDSPDEWHTAMQQLLNHPEATVKMAKQAAMDAQRICDPAHTITFWQAR